MKLQSVYPAIRLAVACLILAIGLRTWLVMGLIDPVTVSGSSMVPSHRGTFVEPRCPVCEHTFSIGGEFAANVASIKCPNCEKANIAIEGLPVQRGDRLWIDRLSLRWREPRRWETVVARNPTDAREMCIKRVVGLPGEQIELRDGNVRIDGAIFVKSRSDQESLRRLVHHENARSQRWHPAEQSQWRLDNDVWQHFPERQAQNDWLHYRHPDAVLITDDVTHNAGITRRLNVVDEFLLSFDLRVLGTGWLSLTIDDGSSDAELRITLPAGSLEVIESGLSHSTVRLPEAALELLQQKTVSIELTNIDRQLLLTIEGRVVLRRPWPSPRADGTASPFSIGVQKLFATISKLTVYRDVYYSDSPVGAAPPTAKRWLLGPREYFLLGDNPPVSIDGRLWGPVPERLIIGKPL